MKTITVKTTIDEARELQDFFLGSYAEKALQAAIDSGNEDLLRVAVAEYGSLRENITNTEEYSNDCF